MSTAVLERVIAGAWEEARRLNAAKAARPSYKFYGRNAEFMACRAPEIMLSGPSETGKTITALSLADFLCRATAGIQGAIVRKVRADMDGTVLQIFREKVLGLATDVTVYGGEHPEWFGYPNGSRIWVGGMDKPGKVLSGERDFVLTNQAEELELKDWETLITRTTGRAGHLRDADGVPFGLNIGDCNPGPPSHWIWARQLSGKLKFFESRHRDNPMLYNQASGELTPQGTRTLERLGRLTGYRKSRLLDGLWVQAEGVVYDQWADSENVTDDAEYNPDLGAVLWAMDDGYSSGSAPQTAGIDIDTGTYVGDAHPRVILFCQQRPDGGLNIFNESYACGQLTDAQINAAKEIPGKEHPYPLPDFATHGPGQAEIRGRLYNASIMPRQCKALVKESIQELQDRIGADANGHRLLHVHPRCRHLRGEMTAYAYDPGAPDTPIKQFDHGPDAARYLAWILRFER